MTAAPFTEVALDWRRVTSASPCPVCSKSSWCTVAPDGSAARCKQIPSDHASPGEDGDAWIHELRPGVRIPPPQSRRDDDSGQDWGVIAREHQARIADAQVDTLARQLGVDPIALRELGIGWGEDRFGGYWSFPMFAADGSVCGLRKRTPKGEKFAMKGSSLGVIRRLQPDDGMLLICEGESDTAAALSLGFDAIGRPGVSVCADIAAAYARGRDAVAVADNDNPDNANAASGVAALIAALRGTAKSVRLIRPPARHKDLRAWASFPGSLDENGDVSEMKLSKASLEIAIATIDPIESGTGAGDAAESAPAEPPSPIIERWSAIASLDDEPPPARWLLREPTKNGKPVPPGAHGDGFLRRGRVGSLVAAGGAGKTQALIGLAIAVAVGGRWFGHYCVDDAAGKVLLLLAEEDREEVQRRLYWASRWLTPTERRLAEQRIVQLPLMGRQCALLQASKPGKYQVTRTYLDLQAKLQAHAGPDGWALIIADPLSRLAGVPIDLDNQNATAAVQVFESLTDAPGSPAVLLSVHSNKASRMPGERVQARGASALTDGVRWEANLRRDGGRLYFHVGKTNYGPFMEEPGLQLEVGEHGVLRAASAAIVAAGEQTKADAIRQQTNADIDRIVAAVADLAKLDKVTNADVISLEAGIKAVRGRALVKLAVSTGRLNNLGSDKRPDYVVGVVSSSPPIPPGRRDDVPGPVGRDAPHRPGRHRDDRDDEAKRATEGGAK